MSSTDPLETEVRRFESGAWSVCIHLTGTGADGFLAGHADVFHAGVPRCRLALVGQRHDAASATDILEQRARDFIADWGNRDHSGQTGFSEL